MFEGWGAAMVGAAVVGGVASSMSADKAADAQTDAAAAGINASNQQFYAAQKILAPYVTAGSGVDEFNTQAYLDANPDVAADPWASQHPEEHWKRWGRAEGRADPGRIQKVGSLQAQQDLIGLNGPEKQRSAIEAIKESSMFSELAKQGEEGILQNASATGGLRGGNTQGALAQFRPALLSAVIDSQFSKLSGITQLGQASAAGQASAGLQTGANVATLLQDQGAARAGNYLAQGQAASNVVNSIGSYGMLKQAKVF
jgi:hypothetical protein